MNADPAYWINGSLLLIDSSAPAERSAYLFAVQNPAIKESKSRQALKLMMEYIAINSMADDLGKAVALSNWKVKAFAAMGDSSDINFAEVM